MDVLDASLARQSLLEADNKRLRAHTAQLEALLRQADEWMYCHLDRCDLARQTGNTCTCGYSQLQAAIDALQDA